MEIIDTSRMQVFSEFDAADEIVDNTERYRVGLVGDDVIIETYTRGGGWAGGLFFERANLADVVQSLTEVLAANPLTGAVNRSVLKGSDLLGVTVYEAGDAYQRGEIRVQLNNNRPAIMDGMRLHGWSVQMSVATSSLLRDALQTLRPQGETVTGKNL